MSVGVDFDGDEDLDDVLCQPAEFRVPTARQLRALRILAEMDANEVADELGVTPNTVYRWERGEIDPNRSQLRQLLKLYSDPDSGQTMLNPVE